MTLFLGSAADVMAREIPARSVDMVYSDPPFGNEQIWTGAAGSFSDKWESSPSSEAGWTALRGLNPVGAELVSAVCWSPKARAYIGELAGILVAARRVLNLAGSLWLHFDDTMGAHLRVLGDVVFGPEQAYGTIIWRRTNAHSFTSNKFGRVHDTIACWGRTRASAWRLWSRGGEFVSGDPLDPESPVRVSGYVEDQLNATSTERVGYPAQKPIALLERLILSATRPGHAVLDPTCGSGTTLVAAAKHSRTAIGIDVSPDAIATSQSRLSPPVAAQGDLFGAAA